MRLFIIGLLICLLSLPSSVQADQLDDLRKIIENGKYTIEYEVKQDYSTDVKRDKGVVTKTGIEEGSWLDALGSDTKTYLIVGDGENFYIEDAYAHCQLKLGYKFYTFNKITDERLREFYGRDIESVDVEMFDPEEHEEVRYGESDFAKAMLILFPEKAKENDSIYKRISSGVSNEGLTYFDFKSDQSRDDYIDAIRYYFDGDRLVKIKMATVGSYGEYLGDKKYAYNTSITIKNFSTTIDRSLFTPPDMSASRKSIQQAINEQQMKSRRRSSWLGF